MAEMQEKPVKERSNQKVKILYVMKILLEETDEEHHLTMQDLIEKLKAYDVSAERKSLYSDLELLKDYGIDIVSETYGRNTHYWVASREFELAELKLLVDSVQSSKFITEKKSRDIIRNLEGLTSRHQAAKLNRQVFVNERAKNMNEKVFYSVDAIHEAINNNRQISFQYFNWTVDKKQELRHNGERYLISPWALSWDHENYYLIAYDEKADKIKHYRVDKMLDVQIQENLPREGKKLFKSFDMARYAQMTFGMFGGQERLVEITCENGKAGIMIDRFGKEVHLVKVDPEHFTAYVNVAYSKQFVHWVLALGDGVEITGPADIREQVYLELSELLKRYEKKGEKQDET